jgi:hypothetical protein
MRRCREWSCRGDDVEIKGVGDLELLLPST